MANADDEFRLCSGDISRKVLLAGDNVFGILAQDFETKSIISAIEKCAYTEQNTTNGSIRLFTVVRDRIKGNTYRMRIALDIMVNHKCLEDTVKKIRAECNPVIPVSKLDNEIPKFKPRDVGSEYKVFLSYKRGEGDELVKYLHGHLENKGIRAWKDDEVMVAGDPLTVKIREGIEQCDLFVCLMSPNYFKSEWCKGEFELAKQENKSLFPIQWEDRNGFSDGDSFKFEYPEDVLQKFEDLRGKGLSANGNPLRHIYYDNDLNKNYEKAQCIIELMKFINK